MTTLLYLTILLIIGRAGLIGATKNLQCRDENDQPVDWYVMYKIPKLSRSSNPLIREGIAYQYITSDSVSNGWLLSSKGINSKTSVPGNTLAPLYKDDGSSLWTMYNDDAPNQTVSGNYGHTKGVVMANEKQGFWLIHSVPGYPPLPDIGARPSSRARNERAIKSAAEGEYDYPTNGRNYGQSFLCISANKDQFDVIGRQLMYNQIIPYNNHLPENLTAQYPILAKAASKIRIKDAPYNHKASFKSLGGVEFVSFAKSDKWGKDLYDDFVAPQLQSDLYTETWMNGPGKLSSDCTGSKVMNIVSILLEEADVSFKSTQDHSKWAVLVNSRKKHNWVCIGDINRARHQRERGGGTVCLNLPTLWKNYRKIVNEVEACPKWSSNLKNWIKSFFS